MIDIDNMITSLNGISLRKVNVKLYGYDKMCIDKDLIDDNLYQLIDKFNERKVNHRDFYFVLPESVHPFQWWKLENLLDIFCQQFPLGVLIFTRLRVY